MVKPTVNPFGRRRVRVNQAAMCVLPVPLLPMAMTFSRRSMYSQRASGHELPVNCWYGREVEGVQALHRGQEAGALILRATRRWWRSMSSSSDSLRR